MQYEQRANVFTYSCCLGIYIAFSPYIGFHTMMVFVVSWLFSLNVTVVLAVSVMINNPWTMVPVYGLSYLCGDRLLNWLGMNHYVWNPTWVLKGNELIAKYIGYSGFSFWAFMVGGNLLGLTFALMAYPIIKWLFKRLANNEHLSQSTAKHRMVNTMNKTKEVACSVATKVKQVATASKRNEHVA